jgi:hypothetical protein
MINTNISARTALIEARSGSPVSPGIGKFAAIRVYLTLVRDSTSGRRLALLADSLQMQEGFW